MHAPKRAIEHLREVFPAAFMYTGSIENTWIRKFFQEGDFPMPSRLGLVMVLATDMPRTTAFYTDLLGLEVVKELSSPDGAFIFLHSKTSSVNFALQDASKETYGVPTERGGVILGFAVEDADSVYRDWQSKSVEILGEIFDMGAGRIFTARDPSGNYIQVYHLYPQVAEMQKQMGLL
jgi:predicted enzyme related to lactoylglutathione lyase